jgi:hypothetical protein
MDEITINGTVYVPKISKNAVSTDGLKAVLIRSYAAGVHFGFLEKEKFTLSGKVVTLVNTQRIWHWDGACSLSQIALEGVKNPEKCKFSVEVARNEIVNVIETIELTEKAYLNLKNVEIWKK